MRSPLLIAALCFAVAALVAQRAVPPPVRAAAPAVAAVAARPPVRPETPAEQIEQALTRRDWAAAARLEGAPALAGHARLEAWRDHRRRGEQRDLKGIIESKLLLGNLGAIAASESQRQSLRQLDPASGPYTLPERRLADLLVFAPRKLDADAVVALREEMRILGIEGLELNPAGKPLPEAAGVQLRYLGGSAIDRLPAAAFAACPEAAIIDLSSRKEALATVLSGLAGCRSLRLLRLPSGQQLSPPMLAALSTLTGVEELSCGASGLDAPAMAALAGMTALRTLRLDGQLPAAGFAGLGRLAGLRRLTCTLAAGADLAPLAAMPELEELTLAIAAAGTADPGWLRFVRAKVLRLSQAGVDDRHLAAMRAMQQLDRVELSSTSVSDAGVRALAASGRVRVLHLGANPRLTGDVLPWLLRMPDLRELSLACEQIPSLRLLDCPSSGQLERFTWSGPVPSAEVLEHLIAWPGLARVAVSGKVDAEVKKRLDEANERRAQVPPDLPGAKATGF